MIQIILTAYIFTSILYCFKILFLPYIYIQIQNILSKFWSFFSVYSFSLLHLLFLILFLLVTVNKQAFQVIKIHFIQFHYICTQNICTQKYVDPVQETVRNTFG